MTIYTDADLGKHLDLIISANVMARADAETVNDAGTSVLGAGIAVWYKAPRARQPGRRVLVSTYHQGNVSARQACARALAFLVSKGIDASWYDGVMD